MTIETANQIIERVALRHPKFSPATFPQLRGHNAFIALNNMPVDPRRIGDWFADCDAYMVQVEYNAIDELWLVYFREVQA